MTARLLLFALLLSSVSPGQAQSITELISSLGLRESTVAARDMPGWQPPQKILVAGFAATQLRQLQAVVPQVELVAVRDSASAVAASENAQGIIGLCDEQLLVSAPDLHWVQVLWAGVENCVSIEGLAQRDILLTNGQRLSSPAIAEHVMAMLFSLSRGLDLFHRSQLKNRWDDNISASDGTFAELSGRTMLVVGLGGIGEQIAQRAHALGMRVIATRGSRREGPAYIDYVGLGHEAIELATQADVVVNAVPLTAVTLGMFNREFFKAMKSSAFYISVGRGQTTVTADLVVALNEGKISGAALDVTEPEPLPADHALWQTSRVIITPHTAAHSDQTMARIWTLVGENLRRYVAGDKMLSVVDIKRGY